MNLCDRCQRLSVSSKDNSDPPPSLRRVRVELSAHEWLIVEAVAVRYKKPIGWVLAMALRSWIGRPLKKHG